MNETLIKILKVYSTESHQAYANQVHDLSKDTIIALFTDLLTTYINDKNSSTLREFITVSLAGYEHSINKIGFNGFKHTTSGKSIACEAKPKNVSSQDLEDYLSMRRKTFHKLRGNGNFTDYTWARLNKDKQENPNMLVSGFVDGKLIYLLEFPFATNLFIDKLTAQLQKQFPEGDEVGRYLRSANFSYQDFIDSKELKVIYCANNLEGYKNFIVREFYQKLLKMQ